MTGPAPNLVERIDAQRRFFRSGATRSFRFRHDQLELVRKLVDENEASIHQALKADLGKPTFEAFVSETGNIRSEVSYMLDHLEEWMEPERVGTPLTFFPSTSCIQYEPKGVCLIVSPWNYPFQLVFSPLVGALAAGNCAVVKPSELAPATAELVATLVRDTFPEELVHVAMGGIEAGEALLAERFDHIFFTGSPRVGKIVARAAAEHLTPVTLELGGKSPAIIDEKVDLPVAATRIAWSKFLNAGQTCIAPDYVLVPDNLKRPLETHLDASIRRFYGDEPKASPDFARIVSDAHFDRLIRYLDDGNVIIGGKHERDERYIAPTLMDGLPDDAGALTEEIFGPILPIVAYETIDEAIEWTRRHPDPLALYVFSKSRTQQERLLSEIPSGGSAINDALVQFSNLELPFGGRGPSGTGSYHGRFSFETFSHRRAVVRAATWFDPSVRYPPYRGKLKWLKKLLG